MSDRPQVDELQQLALELETDHDAARFDERLKKLAKAKAPTKAKPPK